MNVAYDPVAQRYYGGIGGSPTRGAHTWDSSGALLAATAPMNVDLRSVFYNPNTGQIETVSFGASIASFASDVRYGLVALGRDGNGVLTGSNTRILAAPLPVAADESVVAYDPARNRIYSRSSSNVVQVTDRATGVAAGTITLDTAAAGNPTLQSVSIAYDPVNDVLIGMAPSTKRAYVWSIAGAYLGFSQLPGTALIDNTYCLGYANGQVFVTDSGAPAYTGFTIFGSTPVQAAPTVTTTGASGIVSNAATLLGSVNPNGDATNAFFQYSSTSPTLASGVTTTANQAIGSGTSAVAVTQGITGLSPHTTYYFRAAATNSGGTTEGSILQFQTPNASPSAPNRTIAGTTGDQQTYSAFFPPTDPDGDTVTLLSATPVTGLAVNSFGANSVTFTPLANFTGNASFNYTVQDGFGAVASGTVTVTVTDNDAPLVTAPGNITAEATGPAGRVVTFSTSSVDNIGVIFSSVSPASGSVFPIGTTTVTAFAFDGAGNTGTASFTVTIVDTTPPLVTAPANTTTEATSPAGAVVTFTPSASDIVGVTSLVSTPASGSTFPLGVTTVNVTATDAALNSSSASFTVTVQDTTAPAISTPGNITAEATSATGAVVSFTPTASDAVGVASVVSAPASGSLFPIGTTTVNVTAMDLFGHTSTASFTVTVSDTTAPAITTPANITMEATGPTGAVVTFTPTASDAVGVATLVSAPASGSTFPIGTTTVNVTATDAAANSSSASFTVTVQDTTPPVVTAPANILLGGATAAGSVVTFSLTPATDIVDGTVTPTASPASGSLFPVGVTTVVVSATDAHSNTGSASFTVTVLDPALSVHAASDEAQFTTGETTVYPLANDFVPLGASIVISSVSDSAITINGRALRAPDGYTGSFTYTITDGTTVDTATVEITPGTPQLEGTRLNGLLRNAAGEPVGIVTTTRTSTGAYSASVRIGSVTKAIRFTLGLNGTVTVPSYFGPLTAVFDPAEPSRLQVSIARPTGGPVSGTLRHAALGATQGMFRVALASIDRVSVPGGGMLQFSLLSNGRITYSMTLPDARVVTGKSDVADNGTFVIYSSVARTAPLAFVAGEFNLADLTATDITGEIVWKKPLQTAVGLHASGVDTILTANGCLFATGDALPTGGVHLTIAGGNLPADSTVATTAAAGRVVLPTPGVTSWAALSNGTFTAKITHPLFTAPIVAKGIYMPKSNTAWGVFSGTTVGGRIEMTQP